MSNIDLSVMKRCSKCRLPLPATLEYFAALSTTKLGLASWCRSCVNIRQRLKRASQRPSLESRFWSKVKVGADGSCWEWTGARQSGGYGVFWLNGKNAGAHVVSWMFANGGSTNGLFVCHRCDNPPCVNPSHLFLGDARDNSLDMISKGRGGGDLIRKLFDPDLAEVRRLRLEEGLPYKAIAQRFGVSWETVRDVAKGRKGRGR